MVATGPRPGSTPISVPSTAPPKAYSRLVSVKATPKPSDRLLSKSMVSASTGDESRPQRNHQAQALDEDQPGAHGQDDRVEQCVLPVKFITRQRSHADEQRQRDDHAQ